jgi:glycosyltransferase involved in cell wall biosynthesis
MKSVILIKSNLLDSDPRLAKEIDILIESGYKVNLLCWDRNCKNIQSGIEKELNYTEIKLVLRAPFGKAILIFLPIWWCFEFFNILKSEVDLIHAINFDGILIAILTSKIKRIPLIYELYDIYEDNILLPGILRNLCIAIDKIFMFLSDAVILVDKARIKELNGVPNKNIYIIYNSPPDINVHTNTNEKKDNLTIFYAGAISEDRSIAEIVQAVMSLDGVELILAGLGDYALIERLSLISNKKPNKIKLLGKIPYKDVLKLSMSSDVLFTFYDPIIRLHRFASSNKLFEAMMCGKPIIVNDCTSMADIVRQENCGLVVPYGDVSAIREAILKLKNDQILREELGRNGRRAYKEKYNWSFMEKRLVDLYERLTRAKTTDK